MLRYRKCSFVNDSSRYPYRKQPNTQSVTAANTQLYLTISPPYARDPDWITYLGFIRSIGAVFPFADTELTMPHKRQILEVLTKKTLVDLSGVYGLTPSPILTKVMMIALLGEKQTTSPLCGYS